MGSINNRKIWIARVLVGLVASSNLLAAFLFLIAPDRFAPAFELDGDVGSAAIRGIGLLFLMWNVPYLVAALHPLRQFTSLLEAVIMQTIGVVGESLILVQLPGSHLQLRASVMRFIIFDAAGLILLVVALTLITKLRKQGETPH